MDVAGLTRGLARNGSRLTLGLPGRWMDNWTLTRSGLRLLAGGACAEFVYLVLAVLRWATKGPHGIVSIGGVAAMIIFLLTLLGGYTFARAKRRVVPLWGLIVTVVLLPTLLLSVWTVAALGID